MLWYLPWSENLKKRACRYLLQRYLGNFLEEKLTLDQLSVDLYNGTGTVLDVSLDCEALNELGDSQNWPLEIVDGYMREITVTIPWSTLLKDDSVVTVSGLSLTVQPKVRTEPAVSSMLESMWSSMSSSMQLAADCLRQDDGPPDSNPVEGIEMFAHAIDSILSRVKIRFVNTKIRIEHVSKNGDRGIALEIHIENIDYCDDAGKEPSPDTTDPDKPKSYIVATYTNKKVSIEGVTLYTDEFPSKLRTMARSLIMDKSTSSQPEKTPESSQIGSSDLNFQSAMSDVFYETRSIISNAEPEPVKNEFMESVAKVQVFKREVTPEERATQPQPILFAKLLGRQEVVLKIKHTSEAPGPKVEVEMAVGSLIVFLSPRQLNTLMELVNGLNEPDSEDTSNIPNRPAGVNMQCKPMGHVDFERVEAQLIGNFRREQKPHVAMYGWTGDGVSEDNDSEDLFLPMTAGPGNIMTDSFISTASSMSTSISSSMSASAAHQRVRKSKKAPHLEGDPSAELSRVNVKITSCSCILLHKNILIPVPLGTDCVTPASANRMRQASAEFFQKVGFFSINERKDFDEANQVYDAAAGRSHISLITSAIIIEGSDKKTLSSSQTVCETTITNCLLRETLYQRTSQSNKRRPQGFDIISFDDEEDDDKSTTSSSRCSSNPNIKIKYKQTLKFIRISEEEKKMMHPTTDISIKCTPCTIDIDLTLLERVSGSVFRGGSPPAAVPPPATSCFSLSLQDKTVDVILRFPIADLRPNINKETRRVRPDYLLFKFQDILFSSQQTPSVRPLPTTYTVRTSSLDLYYYENATSEGTHIAQSCLDESFDPKGTTPALPTISLTVKPTMTSKGPFDNDHFEPAVNTMTTSMYIWNNVRNSDQPTPFSNKKTAHRSMIKHEDDPHGKVDEIIVPGNEEEMAEFTTSSVDRALIHLDLNLPILSLQLESKQLYEIIYNRVNSDLLLWEPEITDRYESSVDPGTADEEQDIRPTFAMCSNSGYDSDSGTSSSEENLYYSTYDKVRQKKDVAGSHEKTETHNFCLTMKVADGLLTVYCPARDSNKRVVPGQMGELVLEASRLSMCHVSGLYGEPRTAQLGLRVTKASLFHEALMSIPSEKPPLRLYGTVLPSHLKETIYPSGKGVLLKDDNVKKDMLALALKIKPQETADVKELCLAIGIEQATLRHYGVAGIAWLSQFLDVLDVSDFAVPGYRPSSVLSEIHAHIVQTAIDYRPLYLPIRAVLTLGNFNVSSNVITELNTSCLRFLAQDCALFLSYVTGGKKGAPVQDNDKRPDLSRNYVCVMDVGTFELSLMSHDKTKSPGPHVDLCASNNDFNIRTCWDSASALCRLVTYLAIDGDNQPPAEPSTRHASFCSDKSLDPNLLVGLEDSIDEVRELSPSEMQQVNDLMEEAMKESPNTTLEDEDFNSSSEKEGVEVFFFPDENNMPKPKQTEPEPDFAPPCVDYDHFREGAPEIGEEAKEAKPSNISVANELGDPSAPKPAPRKSKKKKKPALTGGNNTDDEYCILETQTTYEDDDLAEPVVKFYESGPILYIKDHFKSSTVKTDVLKSPKSFPTPVLKYVLREMTVVWHLYGGNDFNLSTDNKSSSRKNVTINEGSRHGSPQTSKRNQDEFESHRAATESYRRTGVRYTSGSERVTSQPAVTPRHNWRTRGGVQRDYNTCVLICLNKVKFQYETYPSTGTHASSQTLAISKIEILDRLSNSQINKLLSQYKMKDEPERHTAHMLIIKAVHLRPDPALSAQECCLKVSLLPLRFNLDQDTLAFLMAFFPKLGSDEGYEDDTKTGISLDSSSRQSTPTHRAPVMSVGKTLRDPPSTPTSLGDNADALSLNDAPLTYTEPLLEKYEAERLVSHNLIQLEEDFQRLGVEAPAPPVRLPDSEPTDDSPIYFRRVVFSPEVPIRLDYEGKRVDMSAGPVAGLLMGLGQLDFSELTLKRLYHRNGVLGLEKLLKWAIQEWLSDIKRNQLGSLLSGIGPMHSLLQFVTGIRDLLWMPVEQWRRDGRVVHGLRRGAASFTARTAVAALDITTRLLLIIQATAETAFDMLTPAPTLSLSHPRGGRPRPRRRRDPARPPADLREGVASAYHHMREGIADTATTITIAARSDGVGVLRALPGAAVAPLALAAAGAADVLGGMRAHLAPHAARDLADKWRTTQEPNE